MNSSLMRCHLLVDAVPLHPSPRSCPHRYQPMDPAHASTAFTRSVKNRQKWQMMGHLANIHSTVHRRFCLMTCSLELITTNLILIATSSFSLLVSLFFVVPFCGSCHTSSLLLQAFANVFSSVSFLFFKDDMVFFCFRSHTGVPLSPPALVLSAFGVLFFFLCQLILHTC